MISNLFVSPVPPAHFLHLSTAGSVALVRAAKADGLPVTAEATPHHISLTDELLASYSALYKVNPPLRTIEDVVAVREGLQDGTIDAIATDHAPHVSETKEMPLDQAPPGMLGLETASASPWPISTCRWWTCGGDVVETGCHRRNRGSTRPTDCTGRACQPHGVRPE